MSHGRGAVCRERYDRGPAKQHRRSAIACCANRSVTFCLTITEPTCSRSVIRPCRASAHHTVTADSEQDTDHLVKALSAIWSELRAKKSADTGDVTYAAV